MCLFFFLPIEYSDFFEITISDSSRHEFFRKPATKF